MPLPTRITRGWYIAILFGALVMAGLYLTSRYNYLLFHNLAEVFSIFVAFGIFILAWNTRRSLENNYILFIGIAYLFVAAVDLIHTLAYTGMGVFPGHGTNLPAQLWIAARYIESLSLLVAPLFIGRKMNTNFVLFGYVVGTSLLLVSIFSWDIFPTSFVEGTGLTLFKKTSEYVISLVLLGSLYLLFRKRVEFDKTVFQLLAVSIVVTIGSELSFTFYTDPFGLPNFIGHFLKIISFYLIYKAIMETGLVKPLDLLFRNLKLSEEALRKSEEHYSALVGSLADAVFRIKGGIITWCNDNVERIYGHKREELIGREATYFYPEHISALEFTETVTAEIKKQGFFHSTTRFQKTDGSMIDIEYTVTEIPGAAPTEVVAVARDITERKRMEEALRASEEKYRYLVENLQEGIWTIDKDAYTTFVNPRMAEMLGYTIDEMQGRHLFSFMDEEGVEIAKQTLERRRKGIKERHDFGFLRKDGERIYAILETSPIWDGDGNYVGAIAGVQDITARKLAEEALRTERNNLINILEAMKDGVYIVDQQHNIEYVNPALREEFGPTGGAKCYLYFSGREESCPDCTIEQILAGRTVRWERDAPKIKKTYDCVDTPVRNLDGSISKLGILRDITDRKRLDQLKDEFIGLVSHELRSPLTVVMGAVNTALTEGERLSPEETRQLLQDAASETETLSHLLGNLLELSRVQADSLVLYLEPIDIANVVKEAIERARQHHPTHKFLADLPKKLPNVPADQIRVERILYNLLGNAAKYSAPGSEIRIVVKPEKERLIIGVSDQGIGISARDQTKLFVPFQRLEDSKGHGVTGIGLGLLVCRRLVEAHGGQIWLESKPGQGTTFFFTLPFGPTST